MKYFSLSKNDLYIFAGAFGFFLGILIFTFYFPNYYNGEGPVKFEIRQGETLNQVIDELYLRGIIPSKRNMKIAALISGSEKKVKAGFYEIPNGVSYLKLLEILTEGQPLPQKLVTIQEGIWQEKLAQLLEDEMGISSGKFMKLSRDKKFIRSLGLNVNYLEGYLLPETYYFYVGSTEEDIIKKLSSEMQKFLSKPEYIEQMKKLKMTKHQILTMASIIDGESNNVNEFRRIAGVYYNRLKRGMLLQADPTIQYIVRHRRKKVNKIYYKDLEIDSPFNTYKYPGLPPAPINNPGKDAIRAALYPEEHDYYYFVADGNGGHIFSRTHSQHLRNVRRYRAWRDSR